MAHCSKGSTGATGRVSAPPTQPAPLILNNSLAKSTFTDYLGSGFKIRESNSTPEDSVILPRSGVAILLVYISKIELRSLNFADVCPRMEENKNEERNFPSLENIQDLTRRIKLFHSNHQGAIVIMVSAVFGEEEIEVVTSQLILKLLPRPPHFLLAHGEAQAASHVQIIAKATQVEMRQVVKARMLKVIEKVSSEIDPVSIAKSLGLSSHDASVLMDTYGNVGNIATLSADEVCQNTSLDKETSTSIAEFFNKDQVD